MDHDAASSRRPVTVMLDADLVRRVSAMSASLSTTVEDLLKSYVQTQEAREARGMADNAQWVAASNAMVEQFGAPGDEYNPF